MALRKIKNPRDVSRIIFRHRKLFFFSSVTTMITILIASNWYPHEYKAAATFTREIDAKIQNSSQRSVFYKLMRKIEGERRDSITGTKAIQLLIENPNIRLDRNIPRHKDIRNAQGLPKLTDTGSLMMQELIIKTKKQISIRMPRGGRGVQDNIKVSISYASDNRELVPIIADYLVDTYIRDVRKNLHDKTQGGKKDAKAKFDVLTARLTRNKDALNDFLNSHPQFNQANNNTYKNKIEKLNELIEDANTSKTNTLEKIKSKNKYLEEIEPLIQTTKLIDNPELIEIQRQISQFNDILAIHRNLGRKDTHYLVKNALKQISNLKDKANDIEKKIEEKSTKIENPEINLVKKEISELDGLINGIDMKIENIKLRINDAIKSDSLFYADRNEYEKLTFDVNETTKNLRTRRIQLDEIEKGDKAIDEGVSWVKTDNANTPAPLSKPYLLMFLGASIAAGIAVGVALIIICELLDRTLSTHEQAVDELKLPILGTISEIVSPKEIAKRKLLHRGIYPAMGAAAALVFLSILFVRHISLNKPDDIKLLKDDPIEYISNSIFPGAKG